MLLGLPLVNFLGVDSWQIFLLFILILLGYISIRALDSPAPQYKFSSLKIRSSNSFLKVTIFFSLVSILGCQLIFIDRNESLGDVLFGSMQERYIALVEDSLKGLTSSSLLSTIGNLMRSFAFIAISSAIIAGKNLKSFAVRYILYSLIFFIIYENYAVNASRVQMIFYAVFCIISFSMSNKFFLRFPPLLFLIIGAGSSFLIISTSQRLALIYGGLPSLMDHFQSYFGVAMMPLGSFVFDFLSPPFFILYLYIIQPLPELLRLISLNESPYFLGVHSFFLIATPLLRFFGINILGAADISNQGMWWGLMGDLYIDFGNFFPLFFIGTMYLMVAISKRFEGGEIFGFSLKAMTIAMIMVSPFIGPFNTFSVSYFALLVLAIVEDVLKPKL